MTQRFYYRPFGELFDLLTRDFPSGVSSFMENSIYDTKFPPCNIFVDEKTLDLEFEYALAGFKLNEIDISFEDDYLYLEVMPEKKEEEDNREALQHGISRRQSKSKYYIPFSKYDVEKASANFEDGILKVKIPAKEERKPKKLRIQG